MDFTDPVYVASNYLVTRFPTPEANLGAVIFAFSWQVWFLILATFVLLGVCSAILHNDMWFKAKRSFKRSCNHCFERSLGALSVFVAQDPGGTEGQFTIGYSIMFTFWGLVCIVLASTYSGQIVAIALNKKLTLPFHDIPSLADCIESRHCVIVTKSLSVSYFERVFAATFGPLLRLKESFDTEPPLVVNTTGISAGILDEPDDTRYRVMYGSSFRYAGMIGALPTCSLDGIQSESSDNTAYPLPMGSPLKKFLNRAILAVRESGVIDKLYSNYVLMHLQSQERCKVQDASSQPMGLDSFAGTLILLFSGSIIAALALMLERLWKYVSDKKKAKKKLKMGQSEKNSTKPPKHVKEN